MINFKVIIKLIFYIGTLHYEEIQKRFTRNVSSDLNDYAKFSLNKLFTYHYAWKIICFLTGNLNNIWSLNNICAHFITNPNTHYFFPCIMNSFWILFSEYPDVVQEFYSAILLFKLVVRISMVQCDVFVSEWCYILVVWNCEHERWEMTSYQPCEVKVCTTILNFKFWM